MPRTKHVSIAFLFVGVISVISVTLIAWDTDAPPPDDSSAGDSTAIHDNLHGQALDRLLKSVLNRTPADADTVIVLRGPFEPQAYEMLSRANSPSPSTDMLAAFPFYYYLTPLALLAEESNENSIFQEIEKADFQWIVHIATRCDASAPPMLGNMNSRSVLSGAHCCYLRTDGNVANDLVSEYGDLATEVISGPGSEPILVFREPVQTASRQGQMSRVSVDEVVVGELRPAMESPTASGSVDDPSLMILPTFSDFEHLPLGDSMPSPGSEISERSPAQRPIDTSAAPTNSKELYLAAAEPGLLIYSTDKDLMFSALRGEGTPPSTDAMFLRGSPAWQSIDPGSNFWGIRRFDPKKQYDEQWVGFLANDPQTEWASFYMTDSDPRSIILHAYSGDDAQAMTDPGAWVKVSPGLSRFSYLYLDEADVPSYTPQKGEMPCRKHNNLDVVIAITTVLWMFGA